MNAIAILIALGYLFGAEVPIYVVGAAAAFLNGGRFPECAARDHSADLQVCNYNATGTASA